MSDNLPEGMEPMGADAPESSARRAASVTLRREGDGPATTAALMDPANQSLAEALRITFRLLQAAMVVIVALFALSGFRSVREGEVGIRLLFGRASGEELPPGFQPSAPYPFGDMVKVQRAGNPIVLGTEFWPYVQDKNRDLPIDRIPSSVSLKPGQDGSLITGDSNIAHTRWRVVFRRTDAVRWAENVLPEQEERIIRAAVSRGIVHAVAQTPIERLLKQSSDDQGSVAAQAKEIAQATLEGMGLGIEIERLYLDDKIPPLNVRSKFVAVESAASTAGKAREEAEAKAAETLSAVAGEAAPYLTAEIDAYALALEQEDEAEAASRLGRIYAILDGGSIEVDGAMVSPKIAGEVTRIIGDARLYASREVSRLRGEYALFQARLDQYRQNPELTVLQVWADGFAEFQRKDFVQTLMVPPGARGVELVINQDPEIIKALDRAAKEARTRAANEDRVKQQQRDKYQTETGLRLSTD